MNKTILLVITLAFVSGITLGTTPQSSAFFWDAEPVEQNPLQVTPSKFVEGNSVNDADRPSGFMRYFTSGDPMNECLWDIVASEACQRGILFDNQNNMNEKLNWLLEKNGYDFNGKSP